jgi:translation initiation factor 2B subunit (eIF-2B alpha/beta/delta family)
MVPELVRRAAVIAADRDSGASEILQRLLPLLADAVAAGPSATINLVRVVCAAQPGMASLWNGCAAAVADGTRPGAFARWADEVRRAPAALIRVAAQALHDIALGEETPRFVTLSYSASVRHALSAAATGRRLQVVCGESRPRYEGRRLATELARSGLAVAIATDGALAGLAGDATAVVVGADAVGPDDFLNKVGTRSLASAAAGSGTPVIVVASRDKFVPPSLAPLIRAADGPADEVWPERPVGISSLNPVFERTPLHLATLIVCEAGSLSPSAVPEVAGRFEAAGRLFRTALGL